MTITLRGKAHAESDTVHSVDVTVPSGVVDGDLLVVFIIQDKPDGTLTADTGTWIEFAAEPLTVVSMSVRAFYRIADSEPTPGSGTWTFSSGSGAAFTGFCAQVAVFFETSGVVTWALEDEQFDRVASGNTLNTTSITGVANSLYIFGSCNDDDENITTDPTGPTKIFEVGGTSAPDGTMASASLASWFELVNAGGITDSYTWGGGTEEITNHAGIFSWSAGDTFIGTAAITIGSTVVAADGTFTAPIYSGTAAITVGSIVVAASGIFTAPIYSGTAAITIGSITVAASGTFTAPIYSGTAVITVGSIVVAASGDFLLYTATATITVGSTVVAVNGTFVAPIYAGTAAIAIGSIVVSASGTFTVPVYTATAVITIGSIAVASSGTFVAPAGSVSTFVIPRYIKPSYKSDYARSASESVNPKLWEGLVGAWVPELGPTGSNLFDISGYKNHGVLTSMDPATDWVIDEEGYSLDYDGTDQHVEIGDHDIFDVDHVTIAVWFKRGDTGARRRVVAKYQDTGNQKSYELFVESTNKLGFLLSSDGVNTTVGYSTNTIPGTGVWQHGVLTFDGSDGKFFVNGIADGSASHSGTLFSSTANVRIGRDEQSDALFLGQIGYASIYNRPLSESEIRLLANDHLAPFRRKPLVISIPAAVGDTFTATAAITIGSASVTSSGTFVAPVAGSIIHRYIKPLSYKSAYAKNASESVNSSLWQGLVGAWVPELGPTGLNLFDISGYGNHGVLTSIDPATGWLIDENGYFLDYDGSNDYVEIGDHNILDVSRLTIAAWIKRGDINVQRKIVGKYSTTGNNRSYELFVESSNKLGFLLSSDGINVTTGYSSSTIPGTGEWIHCVLTFDGSLGRFYTNGVANGSASHSGTLYNSTANLRIGRDQQSSALFLGQIGYVSVYNRLLSESEIRLLANDRLAPFRRNLLVISIPSLLYTGTAAITIGSTVVAASGTFTVPVYTATAAITVGSIVVAASGTFTAPVYSATAAVTIGSVIVAANGTFAGTLFTGSTSITIGSIDVVASGQFLLYSGTAATVIGSTVVVASGTFTAPVYSATAAITVGSTIATASGTFVAETFLATAAITLGSVVVAASGTFVTLHSATATVAVGSVAVVAAGTFVAPIYSGSATIAVGSIVVTASGTFGLAGLHTATAAVSISAIVVSVSGINIPPLTESPIMETLEPVNLLDALTPVNLAEFIIDDFDAEFEQ